MDLGSDEYEIKTVAAATPSRLLALPTDLQHRCWSFLSIRDSLQWPCKTWMAMDHDAECDRTDRYTLVLRSNERSGGEQVAGSQRLPLAWDEPSTGENKDQTFLNGYAKQFGTMALSLCKWLSRNAARIRVLDVDELCMLALLRCPAMTRDNDKGEKVAIQTNQLTSLQSLRLVRSPWKTRSYDMFKAEYKDLKELKKVPTLLLFHLVKANAPTLETLSVHSGALFFCASDHTLLFDIEYQALRHLDFGHKVGPITLARMACSAQLKRHSVFARLQTLKMEFDPQDMRLSFEIGAPKEYFFGVDRVVGVRGDFVQVLCAALAPTLTELHISIPTPSMFNATTEFSYLLRAVQPVVQTLKSLSFVPIVDKGSNLDRDFAAMASVSNETDYKMLETHMESLSRIPRIDVPFDLKRSSQVTAIMYRGQEIKTIKPCSGPVSVQTARRLLKIVQENATRSYAGAFTSQDSTTAGSL